MFYVGVDLGGTNIAVGIVDGDGKIIAKKSVKTIPDREFEEIIKDMADCVSSLTEQTGINIDEIHSIGIGSPGSLNTDDGIMVYANNFKHGVNVPMRKLMNKYIDKPVYLGNDANVAALGEVVCGAAKGVKNAVMITLGTGVGGGIIINGQIYEGQYSAGAEMGHIMLIHNGEQCSCGRKGCWEAYASATALVRQTKEAMKKNPESLMNEMYDVETASARTAFEAARKGDETAQKVVDNYIEYIGEGLVDVVNIFRPEILIIGGGVCNEGDNLLIPLRKFVNKYAYGGTLNPEQIIKTAVLGNDAGIIGAALLGKK